MNGERVEVEGDGLFKHLTKPFPATEKEATIVLKATDLAGTTNSVTAIYDFSPQDSN